MKKTLLILLFLIFGLIVLYSPAFSGPERSVTTDSTYEDYGNCWLPINVRYSTQTIIVISSAPANAGLDINVWRFREIVNTSNGILTLFPNATNYHVYGSSFSISLSSDPFGAGLGDSWIVPGQGKVYGIWSPGTTSGGAGGSVHYWTPNCKP